MIIPFQINSYEESLVEVTKAFNVAYNNPPKRWRIEKTEVKNNAEVYEFKGRVLIEKYNEDARVYETIQSSEEYSVATKHDKEIENYAHCKTMVKFLYFAAQSLNADIEFIFETEQRDTQARMFKVVKSWKAEFDQIGVTSFEAAKYTKLMPFKVAMRKDYPRFPLDQLLSEVKKKYKREKITLKDLCDMVWGEAASRLGRQMAKPRKARPRSGIVLTNYEKKQAAMPKQDVVEPKQEASVRQDVEKEMTALKGLGITKATFVEKCPAMAKKYGHFSTFVANCTDEELFNVKNV